MGSNTSLISSGVDTRVRIARVDRSASRPRAVCVSCTALRSIRHSGFHAASGLLAAQVAKPSFSQMSSHHFIVTRLPNHWCAISWAMIEATLLRRLTDERSGSTSSSRSRKVIAPQFSIAPAAKSGTAMMSSLPNGYLMPKYWLKNVICCSAALSANAVSARLSGVEQMRIGTPSAPPSRHTKSPTSMATR